MVTVEADGKGQIKKIKIDPSVVNPADVEMLEDLVLVAVAEAQKKAQELAQEEMGKLDGRPEPAVQAAVLMRPMSGGSAAYVSAIDDLATELVASPRHRPEDGAPAHLSPAAAAAGAEPAARRRAA